MTGCRWGAKNTLIKNYLYLAEQAGAEVHPMTTVTAVRPARQGGDLVEAGPAGPPRARTRLRAHQAGLPARAPRPPAAAAPDEGGAHPALAVATAGGVDPYHLGGDPRRALAARGRRLHRRRRDHQLVPPRRQHAHRAGPVR